MPMLYAGFVPSTPTRRSPPAGSWPIAPRGRAVGGGEGRNLPLPRGVVRGGRPARAAPWQGAGKPHARGRRRSVGGDAGARAPARRCAFEHAVLHEDAVRGAGVAVEVVA